MGDASKAASKLGWKAKTTFDELVSEMLEADCRAYGIMLASGENTMASRAGAFVVGPSTLPGTPSRPASTQVRSLGSANSHILQSRKPSAPFMRSTISRKTGFSNRAE
ncbi:hypothetical protein [Mesorhizobium sp.]|uniref:hypothetical protein n=1 Tax=Mesorhizobium sp. TaxID=1871066 RepID=UPI00257ECE0D|nr:hypothetical protein [Mesorhizobium sp.]